MEPELVQGLMTLREEYGKDKKLALAVFTFNDDKSVDKAVIAISEEAKEAGINLDNVLHPQIIKDGNND